MNRHDSRRKLSNVRLTRKYHWPYLGIWVFVSLLFILILGISTFVHCEHLWKWLVSRGVGSSSAYELGPNPLTGVLIVTTLLTFAAILALAMTTAHRIAGPYLGLKRTLEEVNKGNFNCRLKFRKYDRLEDVEASFNKMMDLFQKKLASKDEEESYLKVVGE